MLRSLHGYPGQSFVVGRKAVRRLWQMRHMRARLIAENHNGNCGLIFYERRLFPCCRVETGITVVPGSGCENWGEFSCWEALRVPFIENEYFNALHGDFLRLVAVEKFHYVQVANHSPTSVY